MGQKLASLELELTMATGGAIADINRFGGAVDKVSAQAIRDLDKIDSATKQVGDMSPAIASMHKFAETVTQSGVAAARERLQAERSGEAMVRQLERQNAAYGKSREELRSMRAEERARVNDLVGNAELARRIRAEEAALYDKEVAAARRAAQAADALAQEKAVAAEQAVAAAEREAQAVRSAAQAHMMFEAAARKGMAVYREQEAAQAALEREAAAARTRAAAEAAVNAQLLERSRLEAALERNTGVGRTRATDAGATFSALAARAAEDEAQAVRSAAQAHVMFEAAARKGMAVYREQEAAQAAAARETEALAAAGQRLRASIDPAYAAQQRFDAEMGHARTLISAGAISLDDYVAKLRMEQAALDATAGSQARATRGSGAARAAMQGLSFQAQDTFTQLSMGANAFNVLAIQGGQVAGQFANLEGKAGSFARFMIGPWGLAITAAMLVLGALTKGLSDEDEAAKKAKEATEAHRKAVLDLADAQGQAIETARRKQALDVASIGIEREAELATRKRIAAQLDLAKANLIAARARAEDPTLAGEGGFNPGAVATVAYARQVEEMTKQAADNGRRIEKLTEGLAIGAGRLIGMYADAKSTVEGRITMRYEDLRRDLLRNPAYQGETNAAKLGAKLIEANRARDAELEAIRASTKARTHDAETLTSSAVAKALRAALPGTQITATTDGKHVSGSDHYKDRAIDFVPAGGMDSITKADVRRMFEQWGVDIRRNGSGVEQLFGPGDKGHANHFHVAWTKGKLALDNYNAAQRDGVKAAREAEQEQKRLEASLNDTLKALDPLAAAAAQYREQLEKIDTLQSAGKITPAAATEYRVAAIDTENKRRGDSWNASARDILGIEGDPLGGLLDQANDEQRERVSSWMTAYNEGLQHQADLLDVIAQNASRAGSAMGEAFGEGGRALGDMTAIVAAHLADQERLTRVRDTQLAAARDIPDAEKRVAEERRVAALFALKSGEAQVALYGDLAASARGFFREGSSGYKALATAEKIFRAVQLAMSIQSMVQNAVETTARITNAAAQAAADGTAGVAAQAKLPWPANLVAMAATAAALVAAGISVFGGGGSSTAPKTNEGRGTVLGDPDAQSESITRAIAELQQVDTVTSVYARQMAGHLRSIDDQISDFAALLVRSGNLDAPVDVTEGFKSNATAIMAGIGLAIGGPIGAGIGALLTKIPIVGDLLSSLFGTSTKVVSNGLYGGAQSVGSILDSGFDASTYSDVQKKKKLFGITTSNKTSTKYGAADPELEGQITLLLRSFNDAIVAAAGPLGESTGAIEAKLRGFVFDLGRIDLKDLTGEQIEEKLTAIFGAAADNMAGAAFPGIAQFQRAGEGLFQTLVRVASTVEAVTTSLDQLGANTRALGIEGKLGLAGQFDSVADLTSAVDGYFQGFYSKEEQAAAKAAQFGRVFDSLGLALPATLTGFRQLVEAQDLTTAAGQATFATLLQLAPAFADLKAAMDGAKSAADVMAERQDLERKLLEVQGDTAAIRALDLSKLDASNRGLQEQIWAVQTAQEAAKAAEQLRDAWKSVGDTLLDEVQRIRGLNGMAGGGSFAVLMGQFNVANSAARAGDMDVAKTLPQLSRSLLEAAALAATSRQELDRVQAQTAAMLEATYDVVSGLAGAAPSATAAPLSSATAAQAAVMPAAANDTAAENRALREEVAGMRRDLTAALATIAGNTGRIDRRLDDVTTASGGDAISVASAA